jgi:hypothetical protein
VSEVQCTGQAADETRARRYGLKSLVSSSDENISGRAGFREIKTDFSDLIDRLYISANQVTESGQIDFDFG